MHFEWADLITILILIGLEGILSGDNALVLAVLVLRLPEDEQRKALRYGIVGAYVLRVIATLLATYLVRVTWIALLGGLYLLFLPYKHFTQHPDQEHTDENGARLPAKTLFGLSAFWSTVVQVEATDLVFAVDSILVAVGFTHGNPGKTWVIIAGGLLGITMMRMVTLQVLELVKKFPKLIDAAYIVVAWVGVKLLWEWVHNQFHIVPEMPKWLGIGMVVVLFGGGLIYAMLDHRKQPVVEETVEDTERLLGEPVQESVEPAPTATTLP